MSKRILLALAPALALGLAACGGGFTASGDALTESEAADLAAGLAEGGFAGFGSFGGAAPSRAPGVAATNVTVALNNTAPCDGGGTVTVAGNLTANVNQTSTGGTIGFNYTVAPNGCQVTSGTKTFTLTGDPNIKAQGDFTFSESASASTFSGSLNYNGKFKWTSSDGRVGACGVDLTSNYNFSFNTTGSSSGSATLSGTVCGVTVSRSVTVTP